MLQHARKSPLRYRQERSAITLSNDDAAVLAKLTWLELELLLLQHQARAPQRRRWRRKWACESSSLPPGARGCSTRRCRSGRSALGQHHRRRRMQAVLHRRRRWPRAAPQQSHRRCISSPAHARLPAAAAGSQTDRQHQHLRLRLRLSLNQLQRHCEGLQLDPAASLPPAWQLQGQHLQQQRRDRTSAR